MENITTGPDLFRDCDDVYDAASDAIRAINARLGRRGLQLEGASFEALRDALTAALRLAEVEEQS
jgi:inhibitor of KinA sporulation pathway (predicted exonuclease)